MARKSIRQDLILKGLDPNNVEIGVDGLFISKMEPAPNTTIEEVSKNALVELKQVLETTPVVPKKDTLETVSVTSEVVELCEEGPKAPLELVGEITADVTLEETNSIPVPTEEPKVKTKRKSKAE